PNTPPPRWRPMKIPNLTAPVQQAAGNASTATAPDHLVLRVAMWFTTIALGAVILYLLARLFLPNWSGGLQTVQSTIEGSTFWTAVLVGLLAQTVDGALGMAYGVTASTFLLGMGASPAVASASVHIAEIFTTGVSGIAHAKLGNVNRKLFLRLLVPGTLGALLGVAVVTQIDGRVLKPYVAAYLLLMGIYILSKAFRRMRPNAQEPRHVAKLAVFGGFVDAVGGLVIGGIFAAPFAALLCRNLSTRALLISVGTLITLLSAWNVYKALLA